jgi:hypothetical protein
MGSNKNVVISFSIAILLLLSLLLLLTYNSKCSSDNNKSQVNMNNSQIPTGFLGDSEKYYNYENYENNYETYENNYENYENNYETFATQPETGGGVQASQAQKPASSNSVADNYRANPSLAASGIGNYSPDNPEYNPAQMLNGQQNDNNDLNSQFSTGGSGGAGAAGGSQSGMQSCFPRDRLTAGDLLPKDAADSKWARINPSGTGDVRDQNYLTAGYHVGINTVGQSLRNANLQLRSEIPNPQNAVGPWMISTIEPDLRAGNFEIGSSSSY